MLYKENFTLQTKPTTEKAKYGVECYVTSLGEVYKQTTMPIGNSWVYVAHRELKTSDVVETDTKKYNQTSNKNISDADIGVDPQTGQPFLQDLFTEEQNFDNDGTKSYKITLDKKGRIKAISQVTVSGGGSYTDEQAQDAVGAILDNGTVGDVEFIYDDALGLISGNLLKIGGVAITLTGASLMTIASISALVSSLNLVANDITNATTAGKSILTATDIDAIVTLLSLVSTDITDSTSTGRSILTAVNVAAVKTLLTLVASDITDSTSIGQSILTGASAAAIRSILSAQLTDADLDAIAALTPSNDDFLQRKSGAWTNRTIDNVIDDVASGLFSYKRSGKWYHQGINMTGLGTTSTINNTSTVTMSLLIIEKSTTITDIAIEVTTALAGASLYYGLYKVDYPTWTTGALVVSASGVSGATTGVKTVTLGSATTLSRGIYLTAVSHNGAGSMTFRSLAVGAMALIGMNSASAFQAGIYLGARASGGALPSNLSGYTSLTETNTTTTPVFWYKVQ